MVIGLNDFEETNVVSISWTWLPVTRIRIHFESR